MPERRKIQRQYLMYYSRVYDGDLLLGHLVDITSQGIMVMSEKPILTGLVFRLKMELSSDIAEQTFLEFTAKSLWCQPDIDPDFYDAGFELVDVLPSDVEIIERIVEAYALRRETGGSEAGK